MSMMMMQGWVSLAWCCVHHWYYGTLATVELKRQVKDNLNRRQSCAGG
jgi:hypothetical protein